MTSFSIWRDAEGLIMTAGMKPPNPGALVLKVIEAEDWQAAIRYLHAFDDQQRDRITG